MPRHTIHEVAAEEVKRLNFRKLAAGRYLVRTRAGFKQAIKDYEINGSEHYEGYPLKYPSVVVFEERYKGYHYSYARCVPINNYKSLLIAELNTLKKE